MTACASRTDLSTRCYSHRANAYYLNRMKRGDRAECALAQRKHAQRKIHLEDN